MEISSIIISHKKSTIEEMESTWSNKLKKLIDEIYSNPLISEHVVIKTCNRIEVYIVSIKKEDVLKKILKNCQVTQKIVQFHNHNESLLHLLKLSSGIESMIVGEDQILGQIRDQYLFAKKKGTTGKILELAFNKAIQVGKRVRNETNINKGSVSIGSAAVDLAEEILGTLKNKNILVIGAGEIGTLVAVALARKNLNAIYIANRTIEKAKILANKLGGQAVYYTDKLKYISVSDVVICAASAPHLIITEKMMHNINRNILIIDITNPKTVEESVSNIKGISLYTIENLQQVAKKNLAIRKKEAKIAEELIKKEFLLLKAQYKKQKANLIIAKIHTQVIEIKNKEKIRALDRLSKWHTIGESEQKVLEDFSDAFINKLLSEPIKSLKLAAENDDDEFLNAATKIFNLDLE